MRTELTFWESIIVKLCFYADNYRSSFLYGISTSVIDGLPLLSSGGSSGSQPIAIRHVTKVTSRSPRSDLSHIIAPGGSLKGRSRTEINRLVAARGPVPIVSKNEAETIDECSHSYIVKGIGQAWNNNIAGSNCPGFTKIPSGWQTALSSRGFQSGRNFLTLKVFNEFCTSCSAGDWEKALTAWQAVSRSSHYSRYAGKIQEELLLDEKRSVTTFKEKPL